MREIKILRAKVASKEGEGTASVVTVDERR